MPRHGEKSPGLRHGFFFGGDQKAGGGGHSRRNPRHGLPDFRPGPHQLADNVVTRVRDYESCLYNTFPSGYEIWYSILPCRTFS